MLAGPRLWGLLVLRQAATHCDHILRGRHEGGIARPDASTDEFRHLIDALLLLLGVLRVSRGARWNENESGDGRKRDFLHHDSSPKDARARPPRCDRFLWGQSRGATCALAPDTCSHLPGNAGVTSLATAVGTIVKQDGEPALYVSADVAAALLAQRFDPALLCCAGSPDDREQHSPADSPAG
jgi:hypothetical protein